RVFRICNQITRQVFPVELDIDNPAFRAKMEELLQAARRIDAGKERGGIAGGLQRLGGMLGAGLSFARLYFHRTKPNALPETIRLQPAW
ncbi:MAG TPA: magnesium-protoporphyrin IX monomethyl ester (oxidative) cyclase, partial [Erythrobacter sp.]|nr:magnesium-protoporphyrin IX monomethyl ester (oxidative) cyclase [Erythrobacter sp.]